MTAKIASKMVVDTIGKELFPVQLGVGVSGGCEGAAHAARSFILDPTRPSHIAVKLDVRNAFNSVRRDHMLEICKRRCPLIYNLVYLSYGTPSTLIAGGSTISSSTGVQQGDPLGPLLFALAVDDVARSVSSPLNIWYLDDATIGGPVETVANDIDNIIPGLASLGLEVNPSKSEIINIGLDDDEFIAATQTIDSILPGARVTNLEDLDILGSPIHQSSVRSCLHGKHEQLSAMSQKLSLIDSHPALFLLKNCFSLPKLVYTLRSAPCYLEGDILNLIDSTIRSCAETICNVRFDEIGWRQAKLPVKLGGIGLRSSSDIALPAYLASLASSRSVVQSVLSTTNEHDSVDMDGSAADASLFSSQSDSQSVLSHPYEQDCADRYDAAVDAWTQAGLSVPSEVSIQSQWDHIKCAADIETLRPSLDQHRLACLTSASQPHSGDWLNTLPSPSLGTLLDNDSLRVGIAIRLGLQVCEQHKCRCGATIDEFGLHPLSCRHSAGRFPRHAALNDVIKRGLEAAGFPSQLEPVGLDRGDGKRPDGLTLFPFKSGKALVWDATCTDTFSPGNIVSSAVDPGAAARSAEENKVRKYAALTDRYHFVPVAVETSGVLGPLSLSFLKDIGLGAARQRHEPRECEWLFQRISLAIIRGNAHSILSAGRDRVG